MFSLKKELIFYLILFIVFSLVIHIEMWLSNPLKHLISVFDHPIPYHPFLYVLIIYILTLIIRVVFSGIKKVLKKN